MCKKNVFLVVLFLLFYFYNAPRASSPRICIHISEGGWCYARNRSWLKISPYNDATHSNILTWPWCCCFSTGNDSV